MNTPQNPLYVPRHYHVTLERVSPTDRCMLQTLLSEWRRTTTGSDDTLETRWMRTDRYESVLEIIDDGREFGDVQITFGDPYEAQEFKAEWSAIMRSRQRYRAMYHPAVGRVSTQRPRAQVA